MSMSSSTDTPTTTVEQMHARFLREALTQRAADLRRIAAEFDDLAAQVDGAASYPRLADRAIHTLAWGIANLSLERVANEAAGAEVARAKGE